MRMLVALCCGSGLVLLWNGLGGATDRSPLSSRVEPFLNGLDGRPAALGRRPRDGDKKRLFLDALCGRGSRSPARALRARTDADLPLALDLLTLSIMAGEPVQAAFERASRAVGGPVGSAFSDCVADMRAGIPALQALERLPDRLPALAVGRLADSLCIGIERGAPLADTLRAQCDDLRERRRRDLLESGSKREILMLVPVVFLILPVVVALALYPGLVALDLLVA